jgi:hypothetical protein
MMIKDLEISKELTGKDLSAVRGGANFALVGGLNQAVFQGGGIFSPNTNVAVNVPTVTQADIHPEINLNLANVLASANTLLGQSA